MIRSVVFVLDEAVSRENELKIGYLCLLVVWVSLTVAGIGEAPSGSRGVSGGLPSMTEGESDGRVSGEAEFTSHSSAQVPRCLSSAGQMFTKFTSSRFNWTLLVVSFMGNCGLYLFGSIGFSAF